jgi:phosphopantothenoylcysteine decarboxylase/phosphopantothenate--cysteine ligase
VVEPESGYLACGMVGAGRLAANEAIVAAVMQAAARTEVAAGSGQEGGPFAGVRERPGPKQDLSRETVLITAGPTREAIDPVRYISNRSSGKMGYALAEAAARRGARVILVTGPVALPPPAVDTIEVVAVESAEQMRAAVGKRLGEVTVFIGAAAVADYRPKSAATRKIKREEQGAMSLELTPTTDIIAEVARQAAEATIVIGFAAETTNAVENARRKLAGKALHAIVVNDVMRPGIGFDSDRNAVTIITTSEQIEVPENSKVEVAHRVLDIVAHLRQQQAAKI